MTFSGMPVNRDSAVLGSACELLFVDGLYRPRVGAALIQVLNIAPQDNGNVDFILSIGWEEDLVCQVRLIVIPSSEIVVIPG